MIVLVNDEASTAQHLKELIEFMDAPEVQLATPLDWQKTAQNQRLEAVFIGPDLAGDVVHEVIEGVGKIDPNVPIVLLTQSQDE